MFLLLSCSHLQGQGLNLSHAPTPPAAEEGPGVEALKEVKALR
jgi:hypothetical protein